MTLEQRIKEYGTLTMQTIQTFAGEGFVATVTSDGRFTETFGCDKSAVLNALLECLEERQ